MSLDPRRDISIPLRDIGQRSKHDRHAGFSEAVALLMKLLDRGLCDEDAEFVYSELVWVHYFYGRSDQAESVVLARTRRFPNSSLAWIEASKHYGFWLDEPRDMQKALGLGQHAVEVARASGNFVVHALNELCRTARAAGDYCVLATAVESLIVEKVNVPRMDSSFECDFLIGLPEGAVAEDLVRRLAERCSSGS